jgi:hypothetical protein
MGEGDQELVDPFWAAGSVSIIITECPVICPHNDQGSDRFMVAFTDER